MVTRCLEVRCLIAMVLLRSPILLANQPGTCQVGPAKQLFIDDYVIDRMNGARRVLNQPNRYAGKPIVTAEFPWEGRAVVAPVVLWDDQQKHYHMYYWAHYDKDDRIFTCYAQSKDGLRWTKPTLGLYEGPDGTKKNNIVLRGQGRQARMRYVSPNPYAKGRDDRFVMMYIDNVPGLTEFAAVSPDGLHWTTTAKIGDLRNVTGGPPTPNPPFFLIEQKWDTSKLDHRYRAIWRTESKDLKTWSGGTWAVQLGEDEDRNLEFYHAASHFLGGQTYHGLHLGYLYPYHTDPAGKKLRDGVRMSGTIDNELMVSRDTIRWTRVDRGTPFLACGPKGSWDAGMVFVSPEVVLKDELRFYYGGWALEHAAENNHGAIGLARLRLDGFVHVEPTDDQATLTTKPFKLMGDVLHINADARRGSIRVAVLDAGGHPIAGLAAKQCQPLTKNGLRQTVRWSGERTLATLSGEPVRLRFHLTGKVKLYAFRLTRAGSGPPNDASGPP